MQTECHDSSDYDISPIEADPAHCNMKNDEPDVNLEFAAATVLNSLHHQRRSDSVRSKHPYTTTDQSTTQMTSNKVAVHCVSIITSIIFWYSLGYVMYTILLPYISTVVSNVRSVLVGSEKGVNCAIWNDSPFRAIQCAFISQCSYYLSSTLNGLFADIQKMQSLPTLLAYIFSAGWTLYFFVYGNLKRLYNSSFISVQYVHKKINQFYTNPFLPFDYIDQAMQEPN